MLKSKQFEYALVLSVLFISTISFSSQVCQGKIRSLLDQCELTMRKSRLVHRMNVKEMERYGHLSKDFEAQITGAERKIERSKEELAEARQIRRHRQEYDAIAHVIKEKPERRETLKKIADLKAKLGESRALKSELSAKIDLRKKQFHVVMVSLDELSRLIAAEETKEKSAPSGTASVAPSEDGSSEAPMEQQNC